MLKLMKLPTAWGLRNASPFNLKAEALLTMSGQAYESIEALPNKGPKGKLPALIDGEQVIGDSSLIQRHLEDKYEARFDDGLSEVELADAVAYRRMAEEWLYFINLWVRWIECPTITRDAFFSGIPWPLRGLVFGRLQKDVKRTLHGQGLGRHTREEIYGFGEEALAAIAARIGSGPFFFGDTPRSVDAALYPQLLNVAEAPYDTPLREAARKHAVLTDYVRRCDQTIFAAREDLPNVA